MIEVGPNWAPVSSTICSCVGNRWKTEIENMFKSLVFACACIAVAAADGQHFRAPIHHLPPAPYAPAPYAAYAPAPAPYVPPPAPVPYAAPKPYAPVPYVETPRPFTYEYGVNDAYTGASFSKSENQDDYGVVSGEYRVALPDGRTQIVTYRADPENGYIADVKYEGEPVYAPAPAPAYAPAPLPAPVPILPKPAPYAPAPVYRPTPHYG